MNKVEIVAGLVKIWPAAVAGAAFLIGKWWPQEEAKIESDIEFEIDHSNPHMQKIAVEAVAMIDEEFPEAGDARLAVATDAILRHTGLPTIMRGPILAALTALDVAAKKIGTDVENHEKGASASPAAPSAPASPSAPPKA